uniref:TFIIB-type domain-containing protein n=1 Tax=Schistocephalus solidus TaxID=70667 RepID=A0A183TRW7_SCHSO
LLKVVASHQEVLIAGDFNAPTVDWVNLTVDSEPTSFGHKLMDLTLDQPLAHKISSLAQFSIVGMMRCNGCGDKNLVLDDSSGRYVCTSCWQVTEYFDSLTQEPSELVNLRGLRMLHPVSSASLIQATSQFSYQEVVTKTEPLPQKLQLPIKTESPSASPHSHLNGADLLKSEDLKEENAVGVRVTIKQSKLSKRKQSKRCWRLSEPFTVRSSLASILSYQKTNWRIIKCNAAYYLCKVDST